MWPQSLAQAALREGRSPISWAQQVPRRCLGGARSKEMPARPPTCYQVRASEPAASPLVSLQSVEPKSARPNPVIHPTSVGAIRAGRLPCSLNAVPGGRETALSGVTETVSVLRRRKMLAQEAGVLATGLIRGQRLSATAARVGPHLLGLRAAAGCTSPRKPEIFQRCICNMSVCLSRSHTHRETYTRCYFLNSSSCS